MEQSRIMDLISKGIKYEIEEEEKKIKLAKRLLFDRGRGFCDKSPKADGQLQDIVSIHRANINKLDKERFAYMYEMEIKKEEGNKNVEW